MKGKFYIAKQGDRLDSIFYKFYGSFYEDGYNSGFHAFCIANVHLLDSVILQGGERVRIIDFKQEEESEQESTLGI